MHLAVYCGAVGLCFVRCRGVPGMCELVLGLVGCVFVVVVWIVVPVPDSEADGLQFWERWYPDWIRRLK